MQHAGVWLNQTWLVSAAVQANRQTKTAFNFAHTEASTGRCVHQNKWKQGEKIGCLERVELVAELDDLSSANEENFSLIRIMVRHLFKLFKFNSYDNKKRLAFLNDENMLFNLKLLLLSCLDLCYYEELRIQICGNLFWKLGWSQRLPRILFDQPVVFNNLINVYITLYNAFFNLLSR